MFAEQEEFIKGLIRKGAVYRVSQIHDAVDAFCRNGGLPRVSDAFCSLKIKKFGGRLGQRGGNNNSTGAGWRRPKKARNKVYAFCYNPDAITAVMSRASGAIG